MNHPTRLPQTMVQKLTKYICVPLTHHTPFKSIKIESAISSSIKPPPGIPVPLHRQTSQVNQQIIDSPNNRHRHQKQNSSSTNTGRNNNINNQQQHQQSCLAAERDALSTELKVLKDTHRIMTQSLVGAQHTNQDSSKKIIRLENELSSLRKLVLGMQQQQHHQLTHSSTMDKASELRLKQEHAALMIQNTEQQKFIQTLRTETQRLQQVVLGYEDAAVRDRSNHTLSMTEAAKTMSALKAQIGAYETKVADLVKSQSKDVEERANLMERCKQLGEDLMRAVEDKKALMGEKKKVMEDKSKAIQDSFKYQAEVQAAKEKHKLSDSKNSSIIAALEKKVADLEKQLVEPTSKHDSEECSHVDESSDDESANRKNVTVDEQKTINETATAIKDEIAAAWSGKSSPDALITSSYEIISGESPSALQA